MKPKMQPNSFSPDKKDARTLKAVVSAIVECLIKPPYDYQRIIICHSNSPELGPALALSSDATLVRLAGPLPSARAPAIHIVQNTGICDGKILQSIVFLVNQTRSVVVLIIKVQTVRQLRECHKEIWTQIRRRTHLTFKFEN